MSCDDRTRVTFRCPEHMPLERPKGKLIQVNNQVLAISRYSFLFLFQLYPPTDIHRNPLRMLFQQKVHLLRLTQRLFTCFYWYLYCASFFLPPPSIPTHNSYLHVCLSVGAARIFSVFPLFLPPCGRYSCWSM